MTRREIEGQNFNGTAAAPDVGGVAPPPQRRRSCSRNLHYLALALMVSLPTSAYSENVRIRVGHAPNVTHAPALIARATNHFENQFRGTAEIDWSIFHAGPEAIESLFAGAIDLLYVGPNPALNGFVRSQGEALRIVAGVASGGSAFVVRPGAEIHRFEDIEGKRVASPQKGNSQDVALLYLMKQKGLSPRSQGGKVELFNLRGGDQIIALLKGQIDAVWTVEPWVSRLLSEASGEILFEEEDLWPEGKYATALLVARKNFMDEHPEMVQSWVRGHVELIEFLNQNPAEAKRQFNEELEREIGKGLPATYLDQCFSRLSFTYDPMESAVLESAERAYALGYLGRTKVDLRELYELSFLNQAIKEKSGGVVSTDASVD